MVNKILANGTVATRQWRDIVRRVLLFLPLLLIALSAVPAGLIWFISLGHINLVGVVGRSFEKLGGYIFPD